MPFAFLIPARFLSKATARESLSDVNHIASLGNLMETIIATTG
jgi:hypothetical protein